MTPGSPSPAAAVRLKINGHIMLDLPAKPDMGLIIGRTAGQLTLSMESRNKPEKKGTQETHTAEIIEGCSKPHTGVSGPCLLNHNSTLN